ncbi:MAG TPA: hybrid sensor histidine kinase/response regulator [Caldithrix abyssi]|uniref:histidine kinase n=1 Tax=Caldithrix abyssi TaxID=187145 RepID=A0A7V4U4M7_CALAY|nr:hybrid sensor histidine kinase/response regulator [Caldithrix abyssi]
MSEDFKVKILLIEDEENVRESYVDMLGFLGYDVITADNGKTGLEVINRQPIDIVITDLNMPVMNGMEALRRIKKKNEEIQVIVITGFATIENAISAMKQGAFDYITKPVSLEHVKIVLNKCIQQIRSRRENEELKHLNAQLREINELKNKFITITNHELRTPLAVLKGYMDLLEMELEDHPSEDIQEYLGIISNTLTEMINMIEMMHDLSSFESLISKQNRTVFDINALADSLFKEIKILFDKRGVEFSFRGEQRPLFVNADQQLLKKAIRELTQNALKFTETGKKVELSVKFIPTKNQVYVVIKDQGIGIPHEKLDLIFEPFYEVQDVMHHFTSRTDFMGGGIGVGLSLVKEIIEASNGEIAVESKPDEGSIFTVILPLAEVSENVRVSSYTL